MNLETWLSLYRKTGESREDAVDRYIVEQGITDPAEKESLKGQLTTPDPVTPARLLRRWNLPAIFAVVPGSFLYRLVDLTRPQQLYFYPATTIALFPLNGVCLAF